MLVAYSVFFKGVLGVPGFFSELAYALTDFSEIFVFNDYALFHRGLDYDISEMIRTSLMRCL